jgi:hypothetical protein
MPGVILKNVLDRLRDITESLYRVSCSCVLVKQRMITGRASN